MAGNDVVDHDMTSSLTSTAMSTTLVEDEKATQTSITCELLILYGSQTGTAYEVADRIGKLTQLIDYIALR
jgi:sulfite reductase alpha subunit-like flavoprotein